MKRIVKYVWTSLLILLLCIGGAFAQTESPAPERVYSQAELDQMLAPIALYPDSLLSQILMAATYPLEVVQAARWSRAHPDLKGEDAVRAVDERDWDPSVKSLVAFPQILSTMDTKLEWTEQLGDAFLAQEGQVMDTVQGLREKAYDAGNLRSNEQQRIERRDGTIYVEPADPEVVYVPYYDPVVIYGAWWWPAYPPIFWAPWPGYYVPHTHVGIVWGSRVRVSVNFFFGAWDWRHRTIRIADVHPFYYHRFDRRPLPAVKVWRHNPEHRRGVPYRNPVVRERYRRVIGSPEHRREYRGYVPRSPAAPRSPDSPRDRDRREWHPSAGSRTPARENHVARPPERNIERLRPNTPIVRQAPERRIVEMPRTARSSREERPHAFEGVGRGQDVRRFSERGRESARQRAHVRNAPVVRERQSERQSQAPSRVERSSGRWGDAAMERFRRER